MMRLAVAAMAASSATAKLWSGQDMAQNMAKDALERRHNLARKQKGNQERAAVREEGTSPTSGRVLKENDKPMMGGIKMTGAGKPHGGGGGSGGRYNPKTDKGGGVSAKASAKAPSNGGGQPPSPGPKTEKGGFGGKGDNGGGGKSRKVSSGICDKRLAIVFDLIELLGPDSPFGPIDSPADVTDLCYFAPPEEPMDNNLGCPFLYIPGMGEDDPGMGFLTTEEEYVEVLGEEAGEAFWALVLYCECYQGFELGCAAKIPHGPPTSTVMYTDGAGEPKEVLVNGYSEFIPSSTPGDRAEYCKMVGVWNGDFDSDVAQEFTPEVMDCGCYFTGQAKDMVSQCPGVDLGAFFVFPEGNGTDAPTPTPGPFFDGFEEDETFFPEDPWSVENGDLPPIPIVPIDKKDIYFGGGFGGTFGDRRRLREGEEGREKVDLTKYLIPENGHRSKGDGIKRGRRLQGAMDWERTTEEAYEGDYSIMSPDLSSDELTPRFASAILDIGALEEEGTVELPGFINFAYKATLTPGVDALLVLYDGERIDGTEKPSDWNEVENQFYVPPGTKEITFQYAYNYFEALEQFEPAGTVHLDNVRFDSPMPTYFPTMFSTESPQDA